jgi:hypothetical protein
MMQPPLPQAPDHRMTMCPRTATAGGAGGRRRRPGRWLVVGCGIACLIAASVEAAPPRRKVSGRLAGLFNGGGAGASSTTATPSMLPAPQPISDEEAAAIEARTRRQDPGAAEPSGDDAGRLRMPTRAEFEAFAAVVRDTVLTIADKATDAAAPPPADVVVPPRTPRAVAAGVPPVIVTHLEPSGDPPPRTQRFERLRLQIARTLEVYQRRPLNSASHTPWEVMHGFIAFGIPTQVRVGGPAGDLVNAIGWSNMGGRCRGQVMLATRGDHIAAQIGPGLQGHQSQYLAILAQCRVSARSPIVLESGTYTVADLVEEEKLACKENAELTFALIALSHYLPTDAVWTARDGKEWSLAKLVEEEIAQPIRSAACGGTHRLFGLAYGCQCRQRHTGRLDGVYVRADRYVRDYQQFALTKLQNRDGSFSTEWFKYLADRPDDIDRKVQTTGHILEWLVASVPQRQLYDSRIVAAAEFLSSALAREPSREWKIGPLGHALHALNIYQERAWGVVLPGGIAAYHGPMKARGGATVAEATDAENAGARRR